jgi:hypothetical protein
MSARILIWGTIAAAVYGLVYFRGDLQRYIKMRMM